MKIELKNTDFKLLVEWMELQCMDGDIGHIFDKCLKPQYNKAFHKYQNEEQKFKCWSDDEWGIGFVHKVFRLANGQYKYKIGYKDDNEYNQLQDINYTNPLTGKNIKKYER